MPVVFSFNDDYSLFRQQLVAEVAGRARVLATSVRYLFIDVHSESSGLVFSDAMVIHHNGSYTFWGLPFDGTECHGSVSEALLDRINDNDRHGRQFAEMYQGVNVSIWDWCRCCSRLLPPECEPMFECLREFWKEVAKSAKSDSCYK